VEFVQRPLPTTLRGGTNEDFKNFNWEREYPNTLVDEPPNILPPFRAGLNHRILINDINDIPTNTKPYAVPDRYQDQLQKRLEQGLRDGIFYRTVSNKASPMFCTPKKDPTQARFVVDLRKRNSVTQHLPVDPGDQDHILHTLARARYRSAIDLKDGYPQVRIHPDDEKFAAFITPQGTFATRTMEQGDCNAPNTFTKIIQHIMGPYLSKFVLTYLDDIFIYSDTAEEHWHHIDIVMRTLRLHKLYVSKNKSQFFTPVVSVLGHEIDDNGIHRSPDKVAKVKDFPTPKNQKGLERFIGIVNYLSKFLPHLATVAAPLTDLTGSGKTFEWRRIHQDSFEAVKALVDNDLPLRPLDYSSSNKIFLITDASTSGIGAWVGQGPNYENAYPVGFHSRKFNNAQARYSTYDQEFLAIVEACKHFRNLLLGTKFTIVTDHKALIYIATKQPGKRRHARWF